MAPPPVQGALKYQELLDQAAEGRFATVQIAPQHDQVIATTTKGWRYSCPIKDKDFPILLEDARRDDLTLPFEVLPMDPIRANVRDAAILVRNVFGVLYLADQFDMLPWDTTSYGSVAEMEAAKEKRARGEVPEKGQKPLALFAKKVIAKVDEASDKEGSPLAKAKALLSSVLLALPAKKEKEKRGGKSEHDEALQRVLGLTTWDAAAELKAKMGGRRAAFKAKVLDSTVHKNVVKAHDGLVEGHNKVVHDLKDLQQEVQHAVLNAPWVTPRTVDDSVQLPTLEQLLTDACKVHSDGQVAQYIRAHPAPASIAASKGASPVKSALSQLAMAGDEVANYAKPVDVFESEYGFCRLCPEFSSLYGHRVYICKRPA